MDADDVDPAELERALRFIRRINSTLGYTRSILNHLERFSRSWEPGRRVDLIDLATGSADIPLAILDWSDRRGFDVHVVGVDRHATTAGIARRTATHPRLRVVRADVFDLPFADRSFDYALTAMFLHHLDEEQVVRVLRTMDRLARRGIIAADLLRRRRASAWIALFTLASSPMIKHDARTSVRQALTPREVLSLRDRAGVRYARYHTHFGHRFSLAGEK